MDLNLLAPLALSQAANAVMQQQPEGGGIIMISSMSSLRPSPDTAGYGAAKAALNSLAGTLAVEWAPLVRVNSLALGMVQTELALQNYGGPSGLAAVAATVPLGRLAVPEEIGALCAFLASPLAGYVSGAVIPMHGGGEQPAYRTALAADRVDRADRAEPSNGSDQRDRADRADQPGVAR
jgi:NAD(P)-dependent dehydrogenase (short-subunit alcohol dehydrogenase family)